MQTLLHSSNTIHNFLSDKLSIEKRLYTLSPSKISEKGETLPGNEQ